MTDNALKIIKDELERINEIALEVEDIELILVSKALSVAVERIEGFQQPCTRTDYTVGQLDKVVCEMADEALTTIANILSGGLTELLQTKKVKE